MTSFVAFSDVLDLMMSMKVYDLSNKSRIRSNVLLCDDDIQSSYVARSFPSSTWRLVSNVEEVAMPVSCIYPKRFQLKKAKLHYQSDPFVA